MAKTKTVPYVMCACGKRGFEDEDDAEKALGRARAKRERGVKGGNRRGMERESRFYYCNVGDCFHLTSMSRRAYDGVLEVPAMPMPAFIPAQRQSIGQRVMA